MLCPVGRQLAPWRAIAAIAEQVVRLHQFVDFPRALVNDGRFAVSVEAADRILIGVSVRAMNLHGIGRGTLRSDSGKPFRETCLPRVAPAHVLQPSGSKPKQ